MKKSFGKQTLGGGKKMSVYLKNYGRSTHNLSKVVRTSANVGTLIPIYTNIALNGDKWEIDINSLIKTTPAIAPLFGNFKVQVDVFECPIRNYISALHNNTLNVGLAMEKVKMPVLEFDRQKGETSPNAQMFSQSSLLAYTGLRGLPQDANGKGIYECNALPILAYYDIFKNYYANRQEKKAYVINGIKETSTPQPYQIWGWLANGQRVQYEIKDNKTIIKVAPNNEIYIQYKSYVYDESFTLYANTVTWQPSIHITKEKTGTTTMQGITYQWERKDIGSGVKRIIIKATAGTGYNLNQSYKVQTQSSLEAMPITLDAFDLTNLDDMRETILSTAFYEALVINENSPIPYSINVKSGTINNEFKYGAQSAQNGLCVKTFQSDIFQNWLNSEWIEGVNGISEITKIDTSDGLKLDDLNLAQKVYNLLNRVAVSGGSYEDWQEAVYGEDVIQRAENPIYIGGMSCKIGFEEVVSAAQSDQGEEQQPLGTLAGKGSMWGKKGGKVVVKVKEPAIIMAILSITPLIDYSQGNKWYMDELKTMNDLHKPALDAIGFQDLPTQWMLATAQKQDITQAIGKSPAWIHYMTDVNECYGDFAIGEDKRYMTLQKEYEGTPDGITNSTTYIDPRQFNYTFADKSISAQNFWVQVAFDIKCRRKMSAKVIPNL